MIALLLCFGKRKFHYIKVTKSRYVNTSRVLVATNGIDRVNIMMVPATTDLQSLCRSSETQKRSKRICKKGRL